MVLPPGHRAKGRLGHSWGTADGGTSEVVGPHPASDAGSRFDAPSGIRTRATTLKGWRPGPLVDGGGRSEDTRGRSYHPWPPGRLAQLVERLPYTQVAAGSSPAPPTPKPAGNGGFPSASIRGEGRPTPRVASSWQVGAADGGRPPAGRRVPWWSERRRYRLRRGGTASGQLDGARPREQGGALAHRDEARRGVQLRRDRSRAPSRPPELRHLPPPPRGPATPQHGVHSVGLGGGPADDLAASVDYRTTDVTRTPGIVTVGCYSFTRILAETSDLVSPKVAGSIETETASS